MLQIAEYLINKSTKEQLFDTRNDAGFTALDILNNSGEEDLSKRHLRECLLQINSRLIKSPSTGEPIQKCEGKLCDIHCYLPLFLNA